MQPTNARPRLLSSLAVRHTQREHTPDGLLSPPPQLRGPRLRHLMREQTPDHLLSPLSPFAQLRALSPLPGSPMPSLPRRSRSRSTTPVPLGKTVSKSYLHAPPIKPSASLNVPSPIMSTVCWNTPTSFIGSPTIGCSGEEFAHLFDPDAFKPFVSDESFETSLPHPLSSHGPVPAIRIPSPASGPHSSTPTRPPNTPPTIAPSELTAQDADVARGMELDQGIGTTTDTSNVSVANVWDVHSAGGTYPGASTIYGFTTDTIEDPYVQEAVDDNNFFELTNYVIPDSPGLHARPGDYIVSETSSLAANWLQMAESTVAYGLRRERSASAEPTSGQREGEVEVEVLGEEVEVDIPDNVSLATNEWFGEEWEEAWEDSQRVMHSPYVPSEVEEMAEEGSPQEETPQETPEEEMDVDGDDEVEEAEVVAVVSGNQTETSEPVVPPVITFHGDLASVPRNTDWADDGVMENFSNNQAVDYHILTERITKLTAKEPENNGMVRIWRHYTNTAVRVFQSTGGAAGQGRTDML